jgi:hypothetical protein
MLIRASAHTLRRAWDMQCKSLSVLYLRPARVAHAELPSAPTGRGAPVGLGIPAVAKIAHQRAWAHHMRAAETGTGHSSASVIMMPSPDAA